MEGGSGGSRGWTSFDEGVLLEPDPLSEAEDALSFLLWRGYPLFFLKEGPG